MERSIPDEVCTFCNSVVWIDFVDISSCLCSCLEFKSAIDVAANVPVAFQNSTFRDRGPHLAIDRNFSTVACTDPTSSSQPWWAADLGKLMDVTRVFVTNDHNYKYGKFALPFARKS